MTNRSLKSFSTLGLRSLRTFESAARNLHFTRAAQEMFVTTAAISHQIKEIESQLGVALFTRQGRAVQLTPEGLVMQQAVGEAIAALERGILKLKAQRNPERVRVSASPSMAAKWLVPRLEHFLKDFPSADIQVDVSYVETDFAQDEADLSIRYGKREVAEADVDRLFVENIFPVCSPQLLAGKPPLLHPKDLLQYKLIHVDWALPDTPWPTWRTWMQFAGLPDFEMPSGLHFKQTSLALDAAMAGQGIALGEASLVMNDLNKGRLIKPFSNELPLQTEWAYYLITRKQALSAPMVREFQRWLLREARNC